VPLAYLTQSIRCLANWRGVYHVCGIPRWFEVQAGGDLLQLSAMSLCAGVGVVVPLVDMCLPDDFGVAWKLEMEEFASIALHLESIGWERLPEALDGNSHTAKFRKSNPISGSHGS
jgi:hypothetical protein